MSLMKALLETYDYALDNGLVDNPELSVNGLTILPIYHSNKRAGSNEEIFEITVDKDRNAVYGRFLKKGEIVVFPITEESIIRTSTKIAPHPISDYLSYLTKNHNPNPKKNEVYLKGIEELLEYENENNNENFRIIGEYLIKNTVLEDFLKFYLGSVSYTIDKKFNLIFKIVDDKGKVKEKKIDLGKIFITFKLEKEFSGDITLTRDTSLHNFYISYVKEKKLNKKTLSYCDITGKLDYCIESHIGIIGRAKLISVSNHNETYFGRFESGKDLFHVGYEASQKAHNMLKYLIENSNHSKYIGENAYVINWLSQDLSKGGIDLISEMESDDDFEDAEEKSLDSLGGRISRKLGKYFFGEKGDFDSENDFYVLIIEKVNDGRAAIKYFRRLSRSEAYQRVINWFKSTEWKFYQTLKSPPLYQIVNFVYGQENSNGYLECGNQKLSRSAIERLLPCIIDSQKLPKDILKTAYYKLSNKLSYSTSWTTALNIGCSLIKKYKNDYENCIINADKISEVRELKKSRSFYYGKLMAIYEKIEIDAVGSKVIDNETQKDASSKTQRITHADKLWSSMIRAPERTRFIIETKIKPYVNILKKNNYGRYVFYDKLITEITQQLMQLKESGNKKSGSLNEDFILGYYYQKNAFYQKKDKNNELEENKVVSN